MKIPLERLITILFASKQSERARRQSSDVRAIFPDQSRFTASLKTLDDKALAGDSENCRPVRIAFDSFSRLQFNIYEKAIPEEDDPDDWPAPANDGSDDNE